MKVAGKIDLRAAAGDLIYRRAQLEKGKGNIDRQSVVISLAVQNEELAAQNELLLQEVKLVTEQVNLKQAELAKLNGVSAPALIEISDNEIDNGHEQLQAHALALVERNKQLDEVLKAARAKTEEGTKDPVPEAPVVGAIPTQPATEA